jgi:hypothetical protein
VPAPELVDTKPEAGESKTEEQAKEPHAHYTETLKEDEDDIGPDDSVSHFFDAASVMTRKEPPPQPMAPLRRFADAGTVLYPSAPKKSVQPLKIQLQEPVSKPNDS